MTVNPARTANQPPAVGRQQNRIASAVYRAIAVATRPTARGLGADEGGLAVAGEDETPVEGEGLADGVEDDETGDHRDGVEARGDQGEVAAVDVQDLAGCVQLEVENLTRGQGVHEHVSDRHEQDEQQSGGSVAGLVAHREAHGGGELPVQGPQFGSVGH
ncbi:hypothetical protein ACWD3I_48300 [Streptomyces sp. NPDC002817]|uniref:hypothetical protein n=1 Tax=Streptomyces sp. NPDC088357 TaxID=3154655 RepID=UPI00341C0A81